jgi:hypothetical protein
MDPRLKKARLPANLRSNRSDIKDLNDRASLLKIIGDRKLTLKKREELMKEYNLIMTDLYKKKKKKSKK